MVGWVGKGCESASAPNKYASNGTCHFGSRSLPKPVPTFHFRRTALEFVFRRGAVLKFLFFEVLLLHLFPKTTLFPSETDARVFADARALTTCSGFSEEEPDAL